MNQGEYISQGILVYLSSESSSILLYERYYYTNNITIVTGFAMIVSQTVCTCWHKLCLNNHM